MILETNGLTRLYKIGSSTVVGVRDINLSIEEASFTVISGPSGSGKTTLLNLLGLIDRPTNGKIIFRGMDTTQLGTKELRVARLKNIGFIFQTFNLFPTLTVLENVELPQALLSISQTRQHKEAEKLLEKVGLLNRLKHLPKELSIGEMQRVAIARALINQPTLIFADEPTGELDADTGKEIWLLLENACRELGATIIVATHDMRIAKSADKIYKMRHGEIIDQNMESSNLAC